MPIYMTTYTISIPIFPVWHFKTWRRWDQILAPGCLNDCSGFNVRWFFCMKAENIKLHNSRGSKSWLQQVIPLKRSCLHFIILGPWSWGAHLDPNPHHTKIWVECLSISLTQLYKLRCHYIFLDIMSVGTSRILANLQAWRNNRKFDIQ